MSRELPYSSALGSKAVDQVDDRVNELALHLHVALEVGSSVKGDEGHVMDGIDLVSLRKPVLVALVELREVVRGHASLLLAVTLAHALVADFGRGAEVDNAVRATGEVLDKEFPPDLVGTVLELVHVAIAVAVVCEAVVRKARALQDADELLLGLLLVDETSDECEGLEGVRIALGILVESLQHVVSLDVLPLVHWLVNELNVLFAEVLHEHVEESRLSGADVALNRENDGLVELRQASQGLVHTTLCSTGVAVGEVWVERMVRCERHIGEKGERCLGP
mmetsp:Transcript_1699/g.6045  ORF Transcript_1699/g.6045 Transcript_1699/m.6045 type:complete len:279 (+) Transcript_1699:267-1103(+)